MPVYSRNPEQDLLKILEYLRRYKVRVKGTNLNQYDVSTQGYSGYDFLFKDRLEDKKLEDYL